MTSEFGVPIEFHGNLSLDCLRYSLSHVIFHSPPPFSLHSLLRLYKSLGFKVAGVALDRKEEGNRLFAVRSVSRYPHRDLRTRVSCVSGTKDVGMGASGLSRFPRNIKEMCGIYADWLELSEMVGCLYGISSANLNLLQPKTPVHTPAHKRVDARLNTKGGDNPPPPAFPTTTTKTEQITIGMPFCSRCVTARLAFHYRPSQT